MSTRHGESQRGPFSLNDSARRLMDALLREYPDWAGYVQEYGPADDREAEPGSVRLSVPVPRQPTHRLHVTLRGNTIEVAYDCGAGCGPAERQFVFVTDDLNPAIAEVVDFLRELREGRTVVVRERVGAVTRALRHDGIVELAWFRSADEIRSAPPGKYARIHAWVEPFDKPNPNP